MNLTTGFLIAKYFSKKVVGTLGGSICFMSAYSGFQNEAGKFVYGVTKSGVNYLVKTLAKEGKQINLSANAVAPRIIDSPENRQWVKDMTKVVSPEKICEKANLFFESHPDVSGEILALP